MQLVHAYSLFENAAATWVAGIALCAVISCIVGLTRRPKGRDARTYFPDTAWLIAGIYCGSGLLLSWSLGVLQALLSAPLLRPEQLETNAWLLFTGGYMAVLLIGYGAVWPAGTFNDKRHRHPLLTTVYGALWGLSHSQVFLCFWAVSERLGVESMWVSGISFVLISVYSPLYHQLFWDIRVSPPHNIERWNLRKVILCHTPNLALGLLWLTLWGNFGLWVILQTLCLTACAHSMRFPAWYDDYRAVAGAMR